MYQDFFEECERQDEYNKFLNKYIIGSIIPLIFIAIVIFLKVNNIIKDVCFISMCIIAVLVYFLVGIILTQKRIKQFKISNRNDIKKLLIKYNYYSEKKINYLIKLCGDKIQEKEQDKQSKMSMILFILQFIISIVALFNIEENEKIAIILQSIIIVLVIIFCLIQNILFFKELINAFRNKNDIDYEYLRTELYNILLNEKFKQDNIVSKIKKIFF